MYYIVYGDKREKGYHEYSILNAALNEYELKEYINSIKLVKFYKEYFSMLIIKKDSINGDTPYFYSANAIEAQKELTELLQNVKDLPSIKFTSYDSLKLLIAFLTLKNYQEIDIKILGEKLYEFFMQEKYLDLIAGFDFIESGNPNYSASISVRKVAEKLCKEGSLLRLETDYYLINISLKEVQKLIYYPDNKILDEMENLVNEIEMDYIKESQKTYFLK